MTIKYLKKSQASKLIGEYCSRLCEIEVFADLAVYLASDESDFVTGVTHAFDGGMSI